MALSVQQNDASKAIMGLPESLLYRLKVTSDRRPRLNGNRDKGSYKQKRSYEEEKSRDV